MKFSKNVFRLVVLSIIMVQIMSLVNIVGFASMSDEATPQSETIQSLEDVSVANIDEEKDWGFEAGQSCSVRRSETRNDAVNRTKS